MRIKQFSTLLVLISVLPVCGLFAQTNEYQQANRLMQQQNYEEALPILEELYYSNPRSYVFFDQYTDCLVNLKMFDEAEKIARQQIDDNRYGLQSSMKLAEILHLKGDREEAREIWTDAARTNRNNIQAYYTIGSSMLERQEYDTAIELYTDARKNFGDDALFLNELANTYMQAGRFEESVAQYFRLIIQSPDQMSLVQQRFLRMRDNNLYEIAAFELEDQLMELDISHKAYSPLYQLLAWLLLETEEYQRAFVFARQYENRTSFTIYSLFSLAAQLASAREYELAARAYEYYLDDGSDSVRFRAKEELAAAYVQWAQYLQQNNLEGESRQSEIYSKAYNLNNELLNDAPDYERAERVYTSLIDLSIDHYKDGEKAEYWYNSMKESPADIDQAFVSYAEGRLAIFRQDFLLARQALTRADRATESSNLSERSRYYLSLSDFFAGDFEFAEIQLRSLERRHTSFYANNAIKLRMWIKNGQRADTTGSVLKSIGESTFALHTGKFEDALQKLEPILANPRNMFADDMTVHLSSELSSAYNYVVLLLLNRAIESRPDSPLLERMMWDHAKLAEEIYNNGGIENLEDPPVMFEFLEEYRTRLLRTSAEERFFGRDGAFDFTREYISSLYEELIMKFPDGFYAPFARQKIQSIEFTQLILP